MRGERVVIIGGGAAGLLCAGFAVQRGGKVTVLERGEKPARKLLITGKGRCNLTNNCTPDEFLAQVRTNPRFLYSAANAFPPSEVMSLFERQLGIPLKTERGRRVFPESERSADILAALLRFSSGAEMKPRSRAVEVLTAAGKVSGVRLENGHTIAADKVIIATGGKSYPKTGSTGDGYRLAELLGHTITPCRPSLVPIVTAEKWCAELMGLTLKNVTLTLWGKNGKAVYSELGEMLFTHFGVSGPLVLSASAYMNGGAGKYRLTIDMKPALSEQQLDARILRDFAEFKNRDFANSLDELLAKSIIPVIIALTGIPGETKVNSITREQRGKLCGIIKALPLTPRGFSSVDEAVITSGGVSVKEIDPKTMQSKLVSGLYFAGEVIDVDAFTGGYNLQIAWSTAYAAAMG